MSGQCLHGQLTSDVRWSKADKVRETVRTYTQRLPVPRGARPGAQVQERRTEDEVSYKYYSIDVAD